MGRAGQEPPQERRLLLGQRDGDADPHNIDDASLAAANYLCRATPTLGDEESWRAGIAAYNSASSYLDAVATRSAFYAQAAADAVP